MNKKILISIIAFTFLLAFIHFSYATDIVMDLNSNSNQSAEENSTVDNNTNTIANTSVDNTVSDDTQQADTDNTIYSSNQSTTDDTQAPITSTVTTEELEDSGELSISNMINIILIVVGIVLILLGIAIIIRLK